MNVGTLDQIVGKTPLIELQSLSKITGCRILGKAEFLNPGGSVKDRAALSIIDKAEKSGKLRPGARIYEGTAGNTGIGLATIAAQRGYPCTIVMPNNQSAEKYQTIEALGATLVKVDPVPFANPNHFYHTAQKMAAADPDGQGFWADQFENLDNYLAHYSQTGPELWEQTGQNLFCFATSSGTGGTLGGVSKYLKERAPQVQTVLIDPLGSGLYHWFHHQDLKSEGASVTEGIGIMRLTANMRQAVLDDAMQVTDDQMISMLYHLAKHDGLLVGPSTALNVYGIFQLAKKHQGSGKTFATILCDSALRYQSRVFNPEWLTAKNLKVTKLAD